MYAWIYLQYWWYKSLVSPRRLLNRLFICSIRGHWRKFDTYPRRGMCIRCQTR